MFLLTNCDLAKKMNVFPKNLFLHIPLISPFNIHPNFFFLHFFFRFVLIESKKREPICRKLSFHRQIILLIYNILGDGVSALVPRADLVFTLDPVTSWQLRHASVTILVEGSRETVNICLRKSRNGIPKRRNLARIFVRVI